MKTLVQTKFFNILSEEQLCEVRKSEISVAYDDFVSVLTRPYTLDEDYWIIIRRLNYTYNCLCNTCKEKNSVLFQYAKNALNLIRSEQELVKWRIRYPDRFVLKTPKRVVSNLKLVASQNDIVELVTALWKSKMILRMDDSLPDFVEIMRVLKMRLIARSKSLILNVVRFLTGSSQ